MTVCDPDGRMTSHRLDARRRDAGTFDANGLTSRCPLSENRNERVCHPLNRAAADVGRVKKFSVMKWSGLAGALTASSFASTGLSVTVITGRSAAVIRS